MYACACISLVIGMRRGLHHSSCSIVAEDKVGDIGLLVVIHGGGTGTEEAKEEMLTLSRSKNPSLILHKAG
jgi:hypothetical protein